MALPAIRKFLPAEPGQIEHVGLFHTRWATALDDKWVAVRTTRDNAATSTVPAAYHAAYARWEATGPVGEELVVTLASTTVGPLAIGLGNANPSENGLTLHHTYGTPTLPGSALKGLTRRALQRANLPKTTVDTLLGDSAESGSAFEGAVTFYDAWLVPRGAGERPLHPDTITVHHPNYYKSEGKPSDGKDNAPTDFDDPIPIPFLVVRPGVSFLIRFAIDPAVGFVDQTAALITDALLWALENEGIGGKTNAGYGRLRRAANEPGGSQSPAQPGRSPSVGGNIADVPVPSEEIWESCHVQFVNRQRQQLLRVTRPDGARRDFPQRALEAFRASLPRDRQNRLAAGIDGLRLQVKGDSVSLAPEPD